MRFDSAQQAQITAQERAEAERRERLREQFRQTIKRRELPPLPIAVTKSLGMLEDPDLNIRILCRVLSDDAALAARILAIARSAYYGQRTLPTTLLAAVHVMGLRDLRNAIVSIVTNGLFKATGPIAEALWAHALGTALASRILASTVRHRDPEQAFLAGLLHDVGQMVLMHGDREGFSEIARDARRKKAPLIDREQELYGFDHSFVGANLLESWQMDGEISKAIEAHHDPSKLTDPKSLASILAVADYLAPLAGLGFYGSVTPPPEPLLQAFSFDNDEVLTQAVGEVQQAFEVESMLLKSS